MVIAPPSLAARVRSAAEALRRTSSGTTVELRLVSVDAHALAGADLLVAESSRALAESGAAFSGEHLPFACEDEVVLLGASTSPAPLAEAVLAAEAIVLADPRGPGKAAEAALARAGLRARVAPKLRYVGTIEEVLAAARTPGTVGLALRSELPQGSGIDVISSGFDGARDCPTAAILTSSAHPALARALLGHLTRSSTPQPIAPARRKD